MKLRLFVALALASASALAQTTPPSPSPPASAPLPTVSAVPTPPPLPLDHMLTEDPDATRPRARVLRLADAEQAALRHQPSLLGARAQTEASSAREDQARAGYYPQVLATATYQRTTGNFAPRPGATITPGGGSGTVTSTHWNLQTYDYWTFGVTATQLLWDFNQTLERTRAAEHATDAARETEKSIALQALFAVRRAFFQARAQRALVDVAKETLANQQRHLAQIQGFVAVGTRPEIDLAQARTDVANARVQLITAENAYDTSRAQLAQAMGDMDDDFDVADDQMPVLPEEDETTATLVAKAMASRPELASLAEQDRAQESTARAYRGAYYPTLSATASATDAGVRLDALVPNLSVGATASWYLFQGGITKGQVNEAEANRRSIHAQIDAERLQIRVDVESARLAVRAAKATMLASDEALANAKTQLRLAEGRYASGIGNVIELADAQLAVTSAQAQRVQAEFNLSTARAQLLAAIGRR